MFFLLLAGAAGGFVRGIVGFVKHQFAYKNVTFKPWYFVGMMGLSALVGFTSTWAVASSGLKLPVIEKINPAIAFIVGYAGGDFLENLYKIMIKKTTLYPVTKEKEKQ